MRRKEREVLNPSAIENIIKASKIMHVGMNDNGKVYVLPFNYGYSYEDGKYTFYIHSAKEGRKIEVLKNNPDVGFEIDIEHKLQTADTACGHSQFYQSIVGNGHIQIVDDMEEKKAYLQKIMYQQTGRADWDLPDEGVSPVYILKLEVSELTAKEHM